MREEASLVSQRALWGKVAAAIVLLMGLGYYAHLLSSHLCDAAGGADSSGYVNAARMISRGKLVEPIAALVIFGLSEDWNRTFRPLGLGEGPRSDTLAPFYPLGIPLQMAGLAALFGWDKGPFLLSPAYAILGLLLFYGLAVRLGLSRPAALAGVALLAASPVFLFMSIQPLSDVAATFWSMAAVLTGLLARDRKIWAAASGACFGIGVLVRPANILVLIPLLFALPAEFPAIGLFLAGGLPFGLFAAVSNGIMYGGSLISGYRNVLTQDLAFSNVLSRFGRYAVSIAKIFTPVIPLAAVMAPFLRKIPSKTRGLLVAWFLPFLAFFCFYTFYDAWWYTRFLLPALPAFVLAALFFGREALIFVRSKLPRSTTSARMAAAAFALLFAVVAAAEMRQNKRLKVLRTAEYERAYKTSCLYIRDHLPAKTMILSFQTSGAVSFYTPFVACRWDDLTAERFGELRAKAEKLGYCFYALLFPFEEEKFQARTPGKWTPMVRFGQIRLWHLDSETIRDSAPSGNR